MTEAAIEPGVTRDVYVAMGEPQADGGWTLRLHYKPLVRWVWVGALLMALGGVTAVTDVRYRRLRVRRDVAHCGGRVEPTLEDAPSEGRMKSAAAIAADDGGGA